MSSDKTKIFLKFKLQVPLGDALTPEGPAFQKPCATLVPEELLVVSKALGLGEGGDNDKDCPHCSSTCTTVS